MQIQHSSQHVPEMSRTRDGEDERLFVFRLRSKDDTSSVSLDGGEKAMKLERRMSIAGIAACIAAIVFAIPHFWYYYGVSLAYPGEFQDVSVNSSLLVVGGVAILAAVYAIVFTHSYWVRSLPELIAVLPAWVGSIGFTLWGFAYFALQILLAINNDTSSGQYFASDSNPNAIWGLYWYSLFIVWGLSLGVAALCFHKLRNMQHLDMERKPAGA